MFFNRWVDPDTGHYHVVALEQDFFGDWRLVKMRGGLQKSGWLKFESVPSQAIGHARINKLCQYWSKKGYTRHASQQLCGL